MEDLSSLSVDDLTALAARTFRRRLDAMSPEVRRELGDDLRLVLAELDRRGCHPYFVQRPGFATRSLS